MDQREKCSFWWRFEWKLLQATMFIERRLRAYFKHKCLVNMFLNEWKIIIFNTLLKIFSWKVEITNIWYRYRSIGGRDPREDQILYHLVRKLEKMNPRINGTWQNVTVCTLYRSCKELTKYQYPEQQTCQDCKEIYNHCPWYAEMQNITENIEDSRSCGVAIGYVKLFLSLTPIYLVLFYVNI